METINAFDNQIATCAAQIIHELFALRSHLDGWFAEFRGKGDQGLESSELHRILTQTAQLDRLVRQIKATEILIAKEVARMIEARDQDDILRWYSDGRVRVRPEYVVRGGRSKDLRACRERILEKVRWQLWNNWEPVDRAVFKPRPEPF